MKMSSQDTCLFCRWKDPEVNRLMIEGNELVVRYDNYPAAPGHVQVVPKRHVASLFDLTAEEAAEAFALLRAARERIERDHPLPDGWTIGVNDGPASGQSVPHLHIHLIPRYHGDVPHPYGGIRQATPNFEPESWK
jgi:diadenosine tetraphosphate (Ap4A) HIT family hydrolase